MLPLENINPKKMIDAQQKTQRAPINFLSVTMPIVPLSPVTTKTNKQKKYKSNKCLQFAVLYTPFNVKFAVEGVGSGLIVIEIQYKAR